MWAGLSSSCAFQAFALIRLQRLRKEAEGQRALRGAKYTKYILGMGKCQQSSSLSLLQ